MRRALAALAACLALSAATPPASVSAALEVVVTVSPREVVLGDPAEVLIRTFVPIASDELAVPVPPIPYPAASGMWNVLYPVPDYDFDVSATHVDGTVLIVAVALDGADPTLWRGSFTPDLAGCWTVAVLNFAPDTAGASAPLSVLVSASETETGARAPASCDSTVAIRGSSPA